MGNPHSFMLVITKYSFLSLQQPTNMEVGSNQEAKEGDLAQPGDQLSGLQVRSMRRSDSLGLETKNMKATLT